MKKTILIFAALIIALLSLFQLSKYSFMAGESKIEIIIAIIAVIFFVLGVYLNKKSLHAAKPISSDIDQKQIDAIGLSKREYEVLIQINDGLSNKEIADRLFVSESTIKTHVSNILVKLDAKRRTQAIQKAKALQILPS